MELSKLIYKNWLEIHRNIERTVRFSLGTKIDNTLLELLELLRKAVYTPVDKKIILLNMASEKIDSCRFFLQLLWEARLIPTEKYISIEKETQDVGKIIGGWRKGIISKTSAFKAEERKQ